MTTPVPLLELHSLQSRLPDLIAKNGEPPWSDALVLTDDIQAFLICHPPGQPNDTHYHHHDEWWVVLRGEIDWYIEGQAGHIHARAGDFVFAPSTSGTIWSRWAPSPASASPSTPAVSSTATTAPAANPSDGAT